MVHIPVRRCLACRRTAAKGELVRLAVVGETVTIDLPARQPGRGAYVCRNRACLEEVLGRDASALLRALRRRRGQVTVDGDELRKQWSAAVEPSGRAEASVTEKPVAGGPLRRAE